MASNPLLEAFDEAVGNTPQQEAQEPIPPADVVEAPPTPEPEVEPEPQPEPEAEETAAEVLLAGKYKSVDELEKGFKALEAKLGDGDYRALKDAHDQMQARLEALETQPQPTETRPPSAYDNDWLDEENFVNPTKAKRQIIWAINNEPESYDDALKVWTEVDPAAAYDWKLEVAKAELQHDWEERFAPVQQVPERLQADDQRAVTQQAFNTAWAELHAQNPDLADYEQKLMDEAQTVPAILAVFQGDDPAQMKGTLDLLLGAARQRRQNAEAETAASETEETQAAKAKGTLTRATNTSQSTPKPKLDPLLEEFDKAAGFST